jgi:peptidoglycan/LPS O-acetylase OafA/YrhL
VIFLNLEALRGVAALLVCLSHAPWMSAAFFFPPVQHGWAFVDFFFVLSGFVIAYNYVEKLDDGHGAAVFMIRRAYRLVPLHLVTLAACVVLDVLRNGLLPAISAIAARAPLDGAYWWDVVLSALLLHGVGLTANEGPNGPSWSISTEVFAYLTFAAVCVGVARPWRAPVFAVLAGGSYIVLQMLQDWSGINGPLEYRFFRCLFAFGLGVLVYEVYHRSANPTGPSANLVLQIVAWLAVLILLAIIPHQDFRSSVLPPLFAVIVLLAVWDTGSPLKRALEAPIGRTLGEWSYSIYMVHAFVTSVMGFIVNRVATDVGRAGEIVRPQLPFLWGEAAIILYVAAVLAISYWTYERIEKPWREKGRAAGPALARRLLGERRTT